jgi:hypothetical protein
VESEKQVQTVFRAEIEDVLFWLFARFMTDGSGMEGMNGACGMNERNGADSRNKAGNVPKLPCRPSCVGAKIIAQKSRKQDGTACPMDFCAYLSPALAGFCYPLADKQSRLFAHCRQRTAQRNDCLSLPAMGKVPLPIPLALKGARLFDIPQAKGTIAGGVSKSREGFLSSGAERKMIFNDLKTALHSGAVFEATNLPALAGAPAAKPLKKSHKNPGSKTVRLARWIFVPNLRERNKYRNTNAVIQSIQQLAS